jgi:predicted RNA-binding Zn-ribbon protein involved in translation (DUF1610 family)
MIAARRMDLDLKEHSRFFPKESILSSNIVVSCQRHAVGIIKSWVASKYTTTLKKEIKRLLKAGEINENESFQLFTVGKYSVDRPTETIPQGAIDFYWGMLLDPEVSGRTPQISNRIGMRLTVHTSTVKIVDKKLTSWWLGVSTLTKRATIKIPVKANPHVKSPDEITYGCLVRKDKRGRWRVEVLEKKPLDDPEENPKASRVGVDVGLNSIAATSDGRLYGANFKPQFNARYSKIKDIRANRQRQGLKENSKRLDVLEDSLSGMIKTATGTVANRLVHDYPGFTFVIEDLNLKGCRGQKRFAYKALHTAIAKKAPVLVVNPAYTSQMCPSCGYISRPNRDGIEFHCRSCGRKGHADIIGGKNLVGRSYDKEIHLDDDVSEVREVLRRRFVERRRSLADPLVTEFEASNRRLTTEVNSARNIVQPQMLAD